MQHLTKNLVTNILLLTLVLAMVLVLSVRTIPAATAAPSETSLPEANKILIQYAFEEILNEGHLAVADEIFAAHFQQHRPNLPAVTLGAEGVKLLASLYRSAFFNLRYAVEDIIAEGDKVVIHWTASGLHQRPFGLYAPSGQQVTWTGMTIYQIANGQIVEAWTSQDDLNLIKQLGATTLTRATWGPSYYADGTMAEMATNRDNSALATASATITWGPSYYADDTNVEAGRHRPELEFMRRVDRGVLIGKIGGPSYSTDGATAGMEASRTILDPTSISTVITWGPSYYTNDTSVEVGRNRAELEFMRQVDQQAMTEMTWGPSYYR